MESVKAKGGRENESELTRISFTIPRHDHSESTTSYILRPQVESTESISNYQEKSESSSWVLHFWQEAGVEAEGERDLGALPHVCLFNGAVESYE